MENQNIENIEEKKGFSKWIVVVLVILIIGVVLVISYVVYNIATANPTGEDGTNAAGNTTTEGESTVGTEVKCGNGVCDIEEGELVFCAEDCRDIEPPVAPVMGNQS